SAVRDGTEAGSTARRAEPRSCPPSTTMVPAEAGPQEVPRSAGPPWEGRPEPRRDTVPPVIRARTDRWAQPRSTRAPVARPITAVRAISPAPGLLTGRRHRGVRLR